MQSGKEERKEGDLARLHTYSPQGSVPEIQTGAGAHWRRREERTSLRERLADVHTEEPGGVRWRRRDSGWSQASLSRAELSC